MEFAQKGSSARHAADTVLFRRQSIIESVGVRNRPLILDGRCGHLARFISPTDADGDGILGECADAFRKKPIPAGVAKGGLAALFARFSLEKHAEIVGFDGGDEGNFDKIGTGTGNAVGGIGVLAGDAGESEGELVGFGDKDIAAEFGDMGGVVVGLSAGGEEKGEEKEQQTGDTMFFHAISI